MSDRVHLKVLAVIWALIAVIAFAWGEDDTAGYVTWALAGAAYLASFFAKADA